MQPTIHVTHGHDETGPFDTIDQAVRFAVATGRFVEDVGLELRVLAGKRVVRFLPQGHTKDLFAFIHEQLKDANP